MEVHHRSAEPWRVTLVDTGDDTMTGGRLKRIADYVKDDEAFCLTYGDGVSDVNITELIAFHKAQGVKATLTATIPPGRFGALVSFAFNVGLGNLQNSTLRMKHNRGEFESAADEFLKWNKAGGKELKGLTTRRKDERALYLS